MSTITTTSVNSATANARSQVQQAAQSIIGGSTGNSTMDVASLFGGSKSAGALATNK